MMTIKEVSELLGVSPGTVRRWIDNGKLEAYKTGFSKTCKILIEPKSIKTMLKKM